MAITADRIIDDALSLPVDARLGLVERLLTSLNLPTQSDVDRLWIEEAELRVSDIDSGKVELVHGEEVFAKIRRKYAR